VVDVDAAAAGGAEVMVVVVRAADAEPLESHVVGQECDYGVVCQVRFTDEDQVGGSRLAAGVADNVREGGLGEAANIEGCKPQELVAPGR
jgi:hypothetical protein